MPAGPRLCGFRQYRAYGRQQWTMAGRGAKEDGGGGRAGSGRWTVPQPGLLLTLDRLSAIGRERGEIGEREQGDRGSDRDFRGDEKG